MTQNFYRSEYTEPQWKALIDYADAIDCKISYSKYGNIATIDSTEVETRCMNNGGRQDRMFWAEKIYECINNAAHN